MMRFLSSRIGLAIVVSLALVAIATSFKLSREPKSDELRDKVSIIASESVKKIKSGDLNALDTIAGTTTGSESAFENLVGTGSPAPEENLTATDRFARELFALYAEAKQSGQSIDAVTAEKIAELVLSNDYSTEIDLVSPQELRINPDTSRAAIKTYGNAVGQALSTPRPKGDQELIILERAIESELLDEEARYLGLVLAYYGKMKKSLEVMGVQKGAEAAHADLINGIGYLARGIEGMLTLDADPIGSLTKIKEYEDGMSLLGAGALGLRNYFKTKNVTFSSDESGYSLVR